MNPPSARGDKIPGQAFDERDFDDEETAMRRTRVALSTAGALIAAFAVKPGRGDGRRAAIEPSSAVHQSD
jgi:hypothetical protein